MLGFEYEAGAHIRQIDCNLLKSLAKPRERERFRWIKQNGENADTENTSDDSATAEVKRNSSNGGKKTKRVDYEMNDIEINSWRPYATFVLCTMLMLVEI